MAERRPGLLDEEERGRDEREHDEQRRAGDDDAEGRICEAQALRTQRLRLADVPPC